MTDILQKICDDKRALVERLKSEIPFTEMDRVAHKASPVRGFAAAIRQRKIANDFAFITEIKKASPSAGILRPEFSPTNLAIDYGMAGATCLSVLTDEPYFHGKNDDLMQAREACDLPILRKDFMLDIWQIVESRALGADCILLIMAALDDPTAKALHNVASDYGMDVLIETHNEQEMQRALKLPSGIIGINNRNLKNLEIDLATTEILRPMVPQDRLVISESGIRNADDIKRLRLVPVDGFLVGESLLKQDNISKALNNLRS
jgi:indole-3-glycerol phosphate synthase